jgi:hypothetical protein
VSGFYGQEKAKVYILKMGRGELVAMRQAVSFYEQHLQAEYERKMRKNNKDGCTCGPHPYLYGLQELLALNATEET